MLLSFLVENKELSVVGKVLYGMEARFHCKTCGIELTKYIIWVKMDYVDI